MLLLSAVTVTYRYKEASTLYVVCCHQSGMGIRIGGRDVT